MRVGGNHHVELGAGVQDILDAGVRHAVFVLDAHVVHADQHVILAFQGIDAGAGLLQRIGDQAVREVYGVPARDVRGNHADHRDADAVELKNGRGVGNGLAVLVVHVAGQDLRVEVTDGLFQHTHAVVVLVVAGHDDVVIQRVEGLDHWMDVIAAEEDVSGVVLDDITGVYQQGRLGAVLSDGGGQLCHTAGGARRVQRVVPGHELAVKVTGADDADGPGLGCVLCHDRQGERREENQRKGTYDPLLHVDSFLSCAPT